MFGVRAAGLMVAGALVAQTCLAAAVPNVVFLLADDLGLGDVGFTKQFAVTPGAGGGGYTYNPPRTPNLDEMATSNSSLLFKYFYAGSAVCSPTRASLLTGRSPERDCIDNAEGCGQEPAWSCFDELPLPPSTFTLAEAARAANASTLFLGKWHLGNFWVKDGDPRKTPADRKWPASNPGMHGFDQWHATEASAESSTTNCGCVPGWKEEGSGCIIGGGFWTRNQSLECTNYWGPAPGSASSPGCAGPKSAGRDCVSNLTTKIPGDDTSHILDRFEAFLEERQQQGDTRPFVAMLWLHTNHVPHFALPEFYHAYNDSLGNEAGDYLGTISQMDAQIARYRDLLRRYGEDDGTLSWFTADNGAHTAGRSGGQLSASQGLRQCKASLFDGGVREPAFVHWPAGVRSHRVVRRASSTLDVLATVQDLVGGASANPNPDWAVDGVSLADLVRGADDTPRSRVMPFAQSGQYAAINQTVGHTWKLVVAPQRGQCPDFLPPFGSMSHPCADGCLFDLDSDPSESNDLCASLPEQCASMRGAVADFRASVAASRANETGCGAGAPPSPAGAFRLALRADPSRCLTLPAGGRSRLAPEHLVPSLGPCATAATWRTEAATGYLASDAMANTCVKAEAEHYPVCSDGTPVWTGECGTGEIPDPDVRFDRTSGLLKPAGCGGRMCAQVRGDGLVVETCGASSATFEAVPPAGREQAPA